MLSVAHLPALPVAHPERGVSAPGLQPVADWFAEAFNQLTPEEATRKARCLFWRHSTPTS